jgi:AcrR family transcriptional regulator
MQYLKENIRESIIEAARDEFFEKGFEMASMRSIAKRTGITAGNLYRYFKSKRDLFHHIISPVFNRLVDLIEHHDHGPDGKKHNLNTILLYQSEMIANIMGERRRELLTLIDGSAGTEFKDAKEMLVKFLSESALEHIEAYYKNRGERGDISLARSIVVSFFEGYWDIIRNNEEGERIMELAREYTKLWFLGFREIL